ncbi:hypothetical protein L9G15_26710, partial [Shewanella sp. A3A]|nr:hypothetical protein [Shewanella ferrihydritica]
VIQAEYKGQNTEAWACVLDNIQKACTQSDEDDEQLPDHHHHYFLDHRLLAPLYVHPTCKPPQPPPQR